MSLSQSRFVLKELFVLLEFIDPDLLDCLTVLLFQTFCDIKDLSYGKESVPISCVNGIDRQYPDYVEYSNIRMPMRGVQLNLDENFLVGCDCTDGCRVRNEHEKKYYASWFILNLYTFPFTCMDF